MLCPRAQIPSSWYSGGLLSLCFMLKPPGNLSRKSPPTVCPSGVVLLWCDLVGLGPLPLLWLATAMLMVLLQVTALAEDFLFDDAALAWCLVGASSLAFVLLVTSAAYLGRLPIPVKIPPAPTADSSDAGSIGEVVPHVYASNACNYAWGGWCKNQYCPPRSAYYLHLPGRGGGE